MVSLASFRTDGRCPKTTQLPRLEVQPGSTVRVAAIASMGKGPS